MRLAIRPQSPSSTTHIGVRSVEGTYIAKDMMYVSLPVKSRNKNNLLHITLSVLAAEAAPTTHTSNMKDTPTPTPTPNTTDTPTHAQYYRHEGHTSARTQAPTPHTPPTQSQRPCGVCTQTVTNGLQDNTVMDLKGCIRKCIHARMYAQALEVQTTHRILSPYCGHVLVHLIRYTKPFMTLHS